MLDTLKLDTEVLNIYEYGSKVYGTHTNKSDLDFIVVVKDTCTFGREIIDNYNNNYNVYKISEWLEMINTNHIVALESLFLNKQHIIKETHTFGITVNHVETRKSVSSVVSNSYVKCKKKLAQGDDYVGRKSLWHSIRILMYGIQCAKYGAIYDYTVANKYYNGIVKGNDDWETLENKYKPIMMELKKEFQRLTAKDWENYKNK